MLNWSQQLFFSINKEVNKNKFIDILMLFFARYLIYILIILNILWAYNYFINDEIFFLFFLILNIVAVLAGILASWFIAWLWPHRRPIVEHPEIKQILTPWKTWKSFPSDHTLISFTIVFITYIFSQMSPNYWPLIIFFFLAFLVGSSRVYCGVHYPRDIIGGIIFAGFWSFLSYYIFSLLFVL